MIRTPAYSKPPRHAATLIVVRDDGPKPRILMGRRNRGLAFMADKWVFPGGRVDRGDYAAPSASELSPDTTTRLGLEPRHAHPVLAWLPRLALAAGCLRRRRSRRPACCWPRPLPGA